MRSGTSSVNGLHLLILLFAVILSVPVKAADFRPGSGQIAKCGNGDLNRAACDSREGTHYTAFDRTDFPLLNKLSLKQRQFGKAVMDAIEHGSRDRVSIGSWMLSAKEQEEVENAILSGWYPFTGCVFFYTEEGLPYTADAPREFFVDVKASRESLAESERYIQLCKKRIKVKLTKKTSDRKKVNAILKALCKHMTYSGKYRSIKNCITLGKGVCGDYAEIFRALCWVNGIECRYIGGAALGDRGWEEHAWNQVRVGGKWYYVDMTWMDSALSEGDKLSSIKYYLSRRLWNDHRS